MKDYVKYVNKVLGVSLSKTATPNVSFIHLIQNSYCFESYSLNGKKLIFAEYLHELDSFVLVKSQYKILSSKFDSTVVLVFKNISYRQREAMINNNIQFVVANRQVYIPSLGILLQELGDKKLTSGKFRPSTQVLLTYLLNSQSKIGPCSLLQAELGISRNTISVDTRLLESYNLISTYKRGVSKYVELADSKKTVLLNSAKYAISPFSKTVYINNDELPEKAIICGEGALSKYSMLSEPRVKSYAFFNKEFKGDSCDELVDYDSQVCLKLGKYDYLKFTKENGIDPVSIYYELMGEYDERIKLCLDEMIDDFFYQGEINERYK